VQALAEKALAVPLHLGHQGTHSGLAEKLQQFRASVEGANPKQAQYQKRPDGEGQRGIDEIFELRSPHWRNYHFIYRLSLTTH
jgi:hypothetical protein